MIHVFPQETAIQDIAVGQSVPARRVLLRFNRAGKIHFLRMGTESRNPGLPGYVEQLPGQGTSTASITRTETSKWTISAPPGSLARLAVWGPEPVDLGLYRVSFEIDLDVQRP